MYLKFYGLSEKPFSQTPDPKFLYWNDSYREALATLRYGVQERKGFLTMIGEAGTGKTTLLRKLLDDLGPDVVSVLLFNPNVSFEEILEYTLSELGIAVPSGRKLAMLQRLNEFLLAAFGEGKNTILLIDEAQDLETEVLESLRLLSNLETSKEKILQIVLSGQPELASRLAQENMRQLKQRIAVRCRLEPLARSEIAEYLAARLRVAGAEENLFAPDCLDGIWEFSHGIPRLVNTVCDNALLVGYAVGKQRIDREVIGEVVEDLGRLDLDQGPTARARSTIQPPIEGAAVREPETAPPTPLELIPAEVLQDAPNRHEARAEARSFAAPPFEAGPPSHGPPPAVPGASTAATSTGERSQPDPAAAHARRPRRLSSAALSGLGVALLVTGVWIGSWTGGERIARVVEGRLDGILGVAPPGEKSESSDPPPAAAASEAAGAPPFGLVASPPAAPAHGDLEIPSAPTALPSHPSAVIGEAPDSLARVSPHLPPAPPAVERVAAHSIARSSEARRPQEPQVNVAPARRASAPPPPRRPTVGNPTVGRRSATGNTGRNAERQTSLPGTLLPTVDRAADGTGVVVQTGDTLLGLAARTYGNVNLTTLDMVRRANPAVADVNKILPGDTIVFPDPGPAARIVPEKGSSMAVVAVTTRGIAEAQGVQRKLQEQFRERVEVDTVSLAEGEKLYRVSLKEIDGESRAKEVAESLGTILRDPGERPGP